ncbi:hypothetical protein EUGRSUZ_D01303 [Eucalyptus grandis]|uniref:Uncharacterized protein n=2 Tax=Eucalyptus grandis TaxID=71139 RepID=A0A059CFM6_EUCGR|nr:hypothetical protein EUGRSUZ_D01303 [Eucalyptus grandis]
MLYFVTKKGGGNSVPNAWQSLVELIYDFVLNLVNKQIRGLFEDFVSSDVSKLALTYFGMVTSIENLVQIIVPSFLNVSSFYVHKCLLDSRFESSLLLFFCCAIKGH